MVGILSPTPLHRAGYAEVLGLVVACALPVFGLFSACYAFTHDELFDERSLLGHYQILSTTTWFVPNFFVHHYIPAAVIMIAVIVVVI